MAVDFPTLVGRFIHHCGALEFFTNNSIKAFATDGLLSTDAIKSPWKNRIALLRKLLHERSNLQFSDIESLCNEMNDVREKRNIAAHNPILREDPNQVDTEFILVIRHKPEGDTSLEKMTRDDIAELVEQTKHLMLRFTQLVPAATQT